MSNEDQRGFFSRLISGVESSFRTLWFVYNVPTLILLFQYE